MNWKVLLISSIIIATAIYVLPSITAKLAGSHTWELNNTGGAVELRCTRCHEYIFNELNATADSEAVFKAHRNAAGNKTYTSSLFNPLVNNATDSSFCSMCHLTRINVTGAHTQILVRPCIDLNCHGNNATTNNTIYFDAGRMGLRLGRTNVHESWFDRFSGYDSELLNETGVDYTQGYFTCLGCHTVMEVQISRTGEEDFTHNDSNSSARRYL